MSLVIRRLAYGLGAEVIGVSPSKPIDTRVVARLRTAWLEHLVLVFRDMEMSPEEHIAFSQHFGALEQHPVKNSRVEGLPELIAISNRMKNGQRSETANVGRRWHTDGAFTLCPPNGSLLHCRALPDVGGDTWFTNLYMAYDTLSETMKRIVEPLEVVYDIAQARQLGNDRHRAETINALPPVVQPLVRIHPETGRKALYLSESVAVKIYGMAQAESDALLGFLSKHAVSPEFTFRHRWSLHDLVLWDNRCTQHLAPLDYDFDQLRELYRTTILGTPSGRSYDSSEERTS